MQPPFNQQSIISRGIRNDTNSCIFLSKKLNLHCSSLTSCIMDTWPGLKLGRVIWVTFCLGQLGLTWFIKYLGLIQISHWITWRVCCVNNNMWSYELSKLGSDDGSVSPRNTWKDWQLEYFDHLMFRKCTVTHLKSIEPLNHFHIIL